MIVHLPSSKNSLLSSNMKPVFLETNPLDLETNFLLETNPFDLPIKFHFFKNFCDSNINLYRYTWDTFSASVCLQIASFPTDLVFNCDYALTGVRKKPMSTPPYDKVLTLLHGKLDDQNLVKLRSMVEFLNMKANYGTSSFTS